MPGEAPAAAVIDLQLDRAALRTGEQHEGRVQLIQSVHQCRAVEESVKIGQRLSDLSGARQAGREPRVSMRLHNPVSASVKPTHRA